MMAQRFVNFFLILIFIFSCNSDEDSIAITKNNEYQNHHYIRFMFKMNEDFNKKYGHDNSELQTLKEYWKIILIVSVIMYFVVEYLL